MTNTICCRPSAWPKLHVLALLMFWMAPSRYASISASASSLSEEVVQATLDQVHGSLQQQQQDAAISLEGFSRDMAELEQGVLRLESLQNQLRDQQAKVQQLANARQVRLMLEQLEETYGKEKWLRAMLDAATTRYYVAVKTTSSTPQQQPPLDVVTLQQLEQRLDTNAILKESDTQLHQWILQIIQDALDKYKRETLEPLQNRHEAAATADSSDATSVVSSIAAAACPSTADIVQRVQQALTTYTNDGIGKVDHLQSPGTKVVHWLTSDTYVPPPAVEDSLGAAWFRKFLPEDWERLLPEGWQDWSVTMPSYISHSLSFLAGSAQVAPPEAVLQKNTLPGSCWPMARHSGQVTVKLPYPVVVEEITIDHTSIDILPDGEEESAPRIIKVIGYPPCSSSSDDAEEEENDLDCQSLGFDAKDPIDIASFTYDLDGNMVQTFDTYYGQAMKELATTKTDTVDGDSNSNNDDTADPASCSAEAAACTAPPKQSVVGVSFKVYENWGNPEFTCLYRVRIHGERE